ncbi:plexin domain-containing protein 2-like [Saccoglossus kowalevskii]
MESSAAFLYLTCLLLTIVAEKINHLDYNVDHLPNHHRDLDAVVEFVTGGHRRNARDADQNETNYVVEEIQHSYYTASYYGHETNVVDDYWVATDIEDTHDLLSNRHRTGVMQSLSFTFPFYGHDVNNVVVATGGFIYLGSYIHKWLAATQYISPLMANFDPSYSDQSTVRIHDNDGIFTTEWNNVFLADHTEAGNFTFQCSLHRDGRIVFAYKQIAKPIANISDSNHPVKVGLADAYYQDTPIGRGMVRRTIYEYHSIGLEITGVESGGAILLQPQPTCNEFTSCDQCTSSQIGFNCSWCEVTEKCSSGFDRHRQEWVISECDKHGVKWQHQCPVTTTPTLTTSTATTVVTLPPRSHTTTSVPNLDVNPCLSNPCSHGICAVNNHGNYACDCNPGFIGKTCGINIDECASNPCLHDARCTDGINKYYCDCLPGYEGAQCQKIIEMDFCAELTPCLNGGTCINEVDGYHCKCMLNWHGKTCQKKDTSNDIPNGEPVKQVQDDVNRSPSSGRSGTVVGGVFGILITIVVIVVLIGWTAYAYRFPTTKSGILLIEMRRCQCLRRKDRAERYHVNLNKVVLESEA